MPRARPPSRCSTSRTSPSSSRPGAASCRRCSTSTSASPRARRVGIVGESGSGKSVTSYRGDAHPRPRRAHRRGLGDVLRRRRARAPSEREMRDLRGREISMIFQNPRAALNPIRKVGQQIEDVLRQHAQAGCRRRHREGDRDRSTRCASRGPSERYHAYPFELSGGMCQRVVIALALACQPQLLIADEPTTGLDVTTQKTVMDLVVELTRERGMSTILITHDLGLAAAYCDRVVVMEKGHVVETAPSHDDLHGARASPIPRKLMRATPRPGVIAARSAAGGRPAPRRDGRRRAATRNGAATGEPLLVVEKLVKEYPRQGVDQVARRSCSARRPAPEPDDLPRRRRHQLHGRARRERRPGRQIRLRQVDHLDDGDAADRQDRRH